MFNFERNNHFQIKANNFLLVLLIIIVAGSYSTRVTAAVCKTDRIQEIVKFDDISIDYNKMPYKKIISNNGKDVKCSKYNQNIYVQSINGVVGSHKNNFYNTSLPGVRFKWSLKPNGLEHAEMIQGSIRGIGKEKKFDSKFHIVIDGSVQSGKINEIKITMARQDEKKKYTGEILYEYIIPAFNVTARTCKITTPGVNVPMGTVLISHFKNKGDTAGGRSFEIGVQCKGSPNANITWNSADINAKANGVINADSTSSATGIGIQILDSGGNPVKFNQPQDLGKINSPKTLSYMAKYYQTSNRVSAGSVNATATFTVDYK
ncbi:type 1 fimbrial protein [Xenorhabdus budapestensis]|uniref:Type 1 fimbrial protein n=1 Tax=Xenorhabdus budapestensis TaxID=290110 RepID=A0ABX7VBV9_XENBU|nr:fimbrial protein [Xenorhabdus budapestensis]QTL38346.1 type 1 fimbrial protein [Xenorhabdus budapestensis]